MQAVLIAGCAIAGFVSVEYMCVLQPSLFIAGRTATRVILATVVLAMRVMKWFMTRMCNHAAEACAVVFPASQASAVQPHQVKGLGGRACMQDHTVRGVSRASLRMP